MFIRLAWLTAVGSLLVGCGSGGSGGGGPLDGGAGTASGGNAGTAGTGGNGGASGSGGSAGLGGASGSGGTAGGSAVSTLAEVYGVTRFALGPSDVFFVGPIDNYPSPDTGGVFQLPKAGGTPLKLAEQTEPTVGIGIDAQNVYYVTFDYVAADGTARLYRVPMTGGASTMLDEVTNVPIEGPAPDVVSLGGSVYWSPTGVRKVTGTTADWFGTGGKATLADTDYLYGAFSGGFSPTGLIQRQSLASAQVETVVGGLSRPADIAIDDQNVFWVELGLQNDQSDGAVLSVPKTGGTAVPLVKPFKAPNTIAVDATDVYFSGGSLGVDINRVPKSGGTPTTVASSKYVIRQLAVDASHAYFSSEFALFRAPK